MASVTICVISCHKEIETHDSDTETAVLHIHTGTAGITRSSISPDRNLIEDICIMIFDSQSGTLSFKKEYDSKEKISIILKEGEYDIYATANMPTSAYVEDEDEIEEMSYNFSNMEDIGKAFPMCWNGSIKLESGKKEDRHIDFEPLMAKIGIRIEGELLDGLSIKSLRLCQGAVTLRPFNKGGSRAMSESDVSDGDYATAEDLERLMKGETIYLYAAENCQGELLPDNNDPWRKIPDNIEKHSYLCSYMEMSCSWKENADYEGDVTYRFYLGEDAVSNFDVIRNSCHIITLYLTEDNFMRESWRLDASQMNEIPWSVTADFGKNFHDKEDFYITENIRVDMHLDRMAQKYWRPSEYAFSIKGMGKDGSEKVRFGTPTIIEDGIFQAVGTCLEEGEFELVMYDNATGKEEYRMEGGCIHIPDIVAAQEGKYADIPVKAADEITDIYINDAEQDICLYLTDSKGYNLNQSRFYGCEPNLCKWNLSISGSHTAKDLTGYANISKSIGRSGNDGYAARFRIGFTNEGRDTERNRALSHSLGKGGLRFHFAESMTGDSITTESSLYCRPITVWLKPSEGLPQNILKTDFMYAIHNPSQLPIKVGGFKMNSLKGAGADDLTSLHKINGRYIQGINNDEGLIISEMPDTECSVNTADAYMADDVYLFAADEDGISQADIPEEQFCMFHHLTGELLYDNDCWQPEIIGKTTLFNNATYGEHGYRSCGIRFHGYDTHYDSIHNYPSGNTDFSGYGTLMNKEAIKKVTEMAEIDININESHQIIATSSRPVKVKVKIEGCLKSHIRCITIRDPFFTIWGHYFRHEERFESEVSCMIDNGGVCIDDNGLSEALRNIREQKYYSVLDAWEISEFRNPSYLGTSTVREYLKPYGLSLSIEIVAEDDSLIAFRFSGNMNYDYSNSSPVTWPTGLFSSVTMTPSSYSGFDKRVDEDGCPPGNLFKAETISITPEINLETPFEIYYMTGHQNHIP